MIDMLFNASITGAIIILLWYLSYPLSKKYFRASWHYVILKIIMIFMLFPISIFTPVFADISSELPAIPKPIQTVNIDAEKINSTFSDIVFPTTQPLPKTDDVIEQPDNTVNNTSNIIPSIPYLQILWLAGTIIIFSGGIRKMYRFKKQILNSSRNGVDCDTLELFLQCRKQLKMRGRINLRTNKYIKTPLAFGLINPIIILPETALNADEKRLAFIHELTHIKNGDLWLKFIASIVSAVHWFNPLAHLFRRKLTVISEEHCDECVVKTMTKNERFVYGNLILKVVSDISIPQFCSTLSAPSKNLKRRLFNMMNTKKSRKSMIVLSVLVALILCSFATIYAFAANTGEPENLTPDLTESADINATEPENEINSTVSKRFAGTLGIGYEDSNGETAARFSRDGGLTWFITDEDYENETLDPDVSAIEWLTYDEFKAWVDEKRAELSDEDIADYETELEDVKNGIGEAGKVIVGDREIIFVFHQSESSEPKVMIGDGETWRTYSQEELDELAAAYESATVEISMPHFQIYDGETLHTYSQEELDKLTVAYESMTSDSSISTVETDDGQFIYTIIGGEERMANSDGTYDTYVYGYCFVRDGGEYYYTDGDDTMGFGADTYKHLYEMVKDFLDGQIETGKMTQEEADGLLAGLSEESTRTLITVDSEGNIIK